MSNDKDKQAQDKGSANTTPNTTAPDSVNKRCVCVHTVVYNGEVYGPGKVVDLNVEDGSFGRLTAGGHVELEADVRARQAKEEAAAKLQEDARAAANKQRLQK